MFAREIKSHSNRNKNMTFSERGHIAIKYTYLVESLGNGSFEMTCLMMCICTLSIFLCLMELVRKDHMTAFS